jgi:hypothetical protein
MGHLRTGLLLPEDDGADGAEQASDLTSQVVIEVRRPLFWRFPVIGADARGHAHHVVSSRQYIWDSLCFDCCGAVHRC